MSYRVAVVGASGNVGQEMLNILAERAFPIAELSALGSERSAGSSVRYGEHQVMVQRLNDFSFKGIDLVLSSPGAAVSAWFAPIATACGAIVVDNTSHFRMDPQVPLVVPEVNPQELDSYPPKGIIANPNCSTIQLVVALKPLHDLGDVRRVVVATYQSVSGAGKAGIDELLRQTTQSTGERPPPKVFGRQIFGNVIPHIDKFLEDGSTKEEWKMAVETRKILGRDIAVSATCVRVPVMVGHSEAVNVEFHHPVSLNQARQALAQARGVGLIDQPQAYATALECAGDDRVLVSRLRCDPSVEHGLNLWIVSDNLRKGAALNAVQIAERLVTKL